MMRPPTVRDVLLGVALLFAVIEVVQAERAKALLPWAVLLIAAAPDGTPDALAVDLLDDDHPIVPAMRYLMKLAAHARRVHCQTGIAWGLVPSVRQRLEAAIANAEWSYVGARGWDPTHIEPVDVTLAEARRGVRPKESL